jgi:WD40 repeat protein
MTLLRLIIASMILNSLRIFCADPVQIVPQLNWPAEGKVSPDKALFAAIDKDKVLIVDGKDVGLIRAIPLRAADIAFSPDGVYLAACGSERGFLLDLRTGKLQYTHALMGALLAFAPDSKSLFVVGSDGWDRLRVELRSMDLSLKHTGHHPVQVPYPEVFEITDEGRTARIFGVHGDLISHVQSIGIAETTVDLKSGEAVTKLKPAEFGASPRRKMRIWDKMPLGDKKKLLRQNVEKFFWDERSGLCVVYGCGMPDGGVVKVWDIRHANFVRTLGTGNEISDLFGFRNGMLLCQAWQAEEKRLTLIDVSTGVKTFLPSTCEFASLSPDGRFIACSIEKFKEEPARLEIRNLETRETVYVEKDPLFDRRGCWSPRGRYFLRQPDSKSLVVVDAMQGHARKLNIGDYVSAPPHLSKENEQPNLWRMAVSEREDLLALGTGGTKYGSVALLDLSNNKLVSRLENLPVWPQALTFISPDRLVVGGYGGDVRLWSFKDNKTEWVQESGAEVTQFGFVKDSPILVCQHMYGSATLLDVGNGAKLRSLPISFVSDTSEAKPWTNPQLIGNGSLAIEADFHTMELRLVETYSGKTILTCRSLPEDQWIVFIPDAHWDGSDNARDFVRFYEGLKRLAPAEANRLQSRNEIDRALRGATKVPKQ